MARGPGRATVADVGAGSGVVPATAGGGLELLDIRHDEGLVRVAGRAVALSARELELLSVLAERSGHVVGREELYARAWGGTLRAGDRIVDVYVRKLRVKLEAAVPTCDWIHTHVGFGYRLDPQWG